MDIQDVWGNRGILHTTDVMEAEIQPCGTGKSLGVETPALAESAFAKICFFWEAVLWIWPQMWSVHSSAACLPNPFVPTPSREGIKVEELVPQWHGANKRAEPA